MAKELSKVIRLFQLHLAYNDLYNEKKSEGGRMTKSRAIHMRTLYRRRNFYYFQHVMFSKFSQFPGLMEQSKRIFHALHNYWEPKKDLDLGLKEFERWQAKKPAYKESADIELFLKKIDKVTAIKIYGTKFDKEAYKRVGTPESVYVEKDGMLLSDFYDFLRKFWANWRGFATLDYNELKKTETKKQRWVQLRKEFAVDCLEILKSFEFRSKRQRNIFIYYMLCVFGYMPESDHRKRELEGETSYNAYVTKLLKP